jgi:hypothetical protein
MKIYSIGYKQAILSQFGGMWKEDKFKKDSIKYRELLKVKPIINEIQLNNCVGSFVNYRKEYIHKCYNDSTQVIQIRYSYRENQLYYSDWFNYNPDNKYYNYTGYIEFRIIYTHKDYNELEFINWLENKLK